MNALLPNAEKRYDLEEVAKAIGITKRTLERRANKEGWPFEEVVGRGGKKRFYPLSALPKDIQAALQQHEMQQILAPAVPVDPLPAVIQPAAALTDKQRAERDARTSVIAMIGRLQAQSRCSREAAMTTLLTMARAGKLEPGQDAQLRLARDARGRAGDGYPSIRTLKRWLTAGDLAPKTTGRSVDVPAWAPALMKLYGQPQKPSLAWCVEQLPKHLERGAATPNYHQASRFLKKMGAVERQRGRMQSREIKTILPFVRRDSSHMWPADCYTADGHTYDAEVAHPKHGRPFRPELTSVLDIATRKCVGWSAGLAESTWAVLDAQRHAVETHGICALWYVDNGSGYANAMQETEVIGFADRLGMVITNSLPYNSQARGVEERSHQSIWVRAAKELPTYMGEVMDRQAKQKVFKITRKDIKAVGTSKLLLPWSDFLAFCDSTVAAYNDRPHRSLPKIADPATGKRRHQTPNEAWQAALDEGWVPTLVTSDEAEDLFRPYIYATVLRGEIRLFNNLYFSHELTEWHGEKVRIGYDLHDGSRVWVRDNDGRLICIAEFEANKRAYFPQSAIDVAADKRAAAREKRLQVQLDEVREERHPSAVLEHREVTRLDFSVAQPVIETAAGPAGQLQAEVLNLPSAQPRPWFDNDPDQYRWLMRNPANWRPQDAEWLLDYTASEDYEDLAARYAYQGVAWSVTEEQRALQVAGENFEVAAG